MLHTKSSSRSYWKLLALLPIVGVTLVLNAETVTEVVYLNDNPQKQVPVKKGKKAGTIKMGSKQVKVVEQDKKDNTVSETVTEVIKAKEVPANNVFQVVDVFDVVEQMPQFPGGMQALMEYLSQNIKYPKEAMEAEKQGRVLVQFIVTKDGSVRAAQVLNHVDEALDAEALRVINAMPNWLPGRQNGEAVNVKYTVPISFRLQGKEKPKAEETTTPTEITHLSFRAADDAAIKDLISRLPGAKMDENGNLTINGKAVKRILVDGKAVTSQEDLKKVINAKTIQLIQLNTDNK